MKCIIIGGFLGSGKTTTIRKLVELLGKKGKKVAILLNEIGEIGIDGATVAGFGMEVRELTRGCICCTLRVSLEQTLKTLIKEYSPDTVVIEPTGIAFPRQIKNNILKMGLSSISFAPLVNLVDVGRIKPDANSLHNFIRIQIEDAELLGLNKIDQVSKSQLFEICAFLHKLNPKARIISFSAREEGAKFEQFLALLEGDKSSWEEENSDFEQKNSIELSEVAAYSTEFEINSPDISLARASSISSQILQNISEKASKLNPEFVGHIKLVFSLRGILIKGSVTSAQKAPEIEILEKPRLKHSKIKLLSAVTDVPQAELVKIVDSSVSGQLETNHIEFLQKKPHNAFLPLTLKPKNF
ncbi:MAG: GTP-binding protein [Methanosarcinaceae archaeon]|nr:GTP-binding protein [Methanosarcinaceae archaeon]